jgi:hypothetical protein
MKKAVIMAVLALAGMALADEVTFTVVGPGTISSSAAGLSAGPSSVVLVTDVTNGKSEMLDTTFQATAGAAHSVTVTDDNYTAFFGHGAAGSVNIPGAVTGNMLDNSEVTAVVDGAGSFSGEFDVTFIDPAILKALGTGPKWAPTGSVGVTFHDAHVSGQTLSGTIGGGSATVLTVETPIAEPATLLLLGSAGLLVMYRVRRSST